VGDIQHSSNSILKTEPHSYKRIKPTQYKAPNENIEKEGPFHFSPFSTLTQTNNGLQAARKPKVFPGSLLDFI
jgi:hypothetical protein